jgi:hypothetical protein
MDDPQLARWWLRRIFSGEAEACREREDEAAVVFFSVLAATVDDVPADVLTAFSALDRTEDAVGKFGEMLCEVGFSSAPNAEDFVRRFIADQCDDEPLPLPSRRWH